jgi:hypothetical protein
MVETIRAGGVPGSGASGAGSSEAASTVVIALD